MRDFIQDLTSSIKFENDKHKVKFKSPISQDVYKMSI